MMIARLKNIFLAFCVLFCSFVQGAESVFAQMQSVVKKADTYYNNNEYIKAIPLYKKASDKNDAALRKLADCYRILKNGLFARIQFLGCLCNMFWKIL